MSSPDRNRRDTARAAQQQEETLRVRWEETQERLLTRFEEPISFATRVTKRTLAWFPVRVWRHFLIANGFLLAAGVSYQALFAIFAAVYVAFALAGLWLGGSEQAIQNLIEKHRDCFAERLDFDTLKKYDKSISFSDQVCF